MQQRIQTTILLKLNSRRCQFRTHKHSHTQITHGPHGNCRSFKL
jgi:hypothetical protein